MYIRCPVQLRVLLHRVVCMQHASLNPHLVRRVNKKLPARVCSACGGDRFTFKLPLSHVYVFLLTACIYSILQDGLCR